MWSPHPFHWVPAGGQRHASTDAHPNGGHLYPDGTAVTTLCGDSTLQADNGDHAWLWSECETCRAHTYDLAGTPPPPALLAVAS
ncbi:MULTISPECIES: zinc finger protein [Saccharopolyspora]|uniref:Uncharacterized protein n=1 Tax=Saccharopolyspora endophytica TaxID=543886 RepID=A0ABS5DK35_9PSEU|nr:zinc finger protein [Saccharopolyspora endophytica]MBQ0926610.1 hypothetical protein [Saccharopolyspora endophytica]